MLLSFAFAVATMIAVLAFQTLLKLVQSPAPLRYRPARRKGRRSSAEYGA